MPILDGVDEWMQLVSFLVIALFLPKDIAVTEARLNFLRLIFLCLLTMTWRCAERFAVGERITKLAFFRWSCLSIARARFLSLCSVAAHRNSSFRSIFVILSLPLPSTTCPGSYREQLFDPASLPKSSPVCSICTYFSKSSRLLPRSPEVPLSPLESNLS